MRLTRYARVRRVALVAALTLVPAIVGCNATGANGRIRHWGTLREVLRDGQTQERVRLVPPVITANTYGVGAVTGLRGEITIIDGVTWVSQADSSGGLVCRSDVASENSATFLATAEVTDWRVFVLEEKVSHDRLEDTIAAVGRSAGLDAKAGFPFVVEGTFSSIELHVIDGRCPLAPGGAETTSARDPIRIERYTANGTLVGFYIEGRTGVLTHHGARTHVHLLIPGDPAIAGHVDAVGIQRGGRVRVPDVSVGR